MVGGWLLLKVVMIFSRGIEVVSRENEQIRHIVLNSLVFRCLHVDLHTRTGVYSWIYVCLHASLYMLTHEFTPAFTRIYTCLLLHLHVLTHEFTHTHTLIYSAFTRARIYTAFTRGFTHAYT